MQITILDNIASNKHLGNIILIIECYMYINQLSNRGQLHCRTEDLFKQLESRELTQEELDIIQSRVI